MSKRKGLLLIGAVFVLAAAGVVYAHWTETLTVNATVETGYVGFTVSAVYTDDDGQVNKNQAGVNWDTGDNNAAGEYDRWGATSSNDPSSYSGFPGPAVATRYTKDVARCRVTSPAGMTLTVALENGYPGYHCTIAANMAMASTVPLKSQAVRAWVCDADVEDCNDPGDFTAVPFFNLGGSPNPVGVFRYDPDGGTNYELELWNSPLNSCGYQMDPDHVSFQGRTGIQVLQDTDNQDAAYVVSIEWQLVNWNEWDFDQCAGFARYTMTGGAPYITFP